MFTRADFPESLPQSSLVVAPPSLWAEIAAALAPAVHPLDVWQLPAEAKRLGVGEVRDLQRFALQTPRGTLKLALLTDATAWSPQVANALLKLLEEPPPYLSLVVLAESDQLLPTVRSRLVSLPLPASYAKLENRSDTRSDRESWQRFLEGIDLGTPAGRQLAGEALYLQAATHSGHRTSFVTESLAETASSL